jgi:hypothetical protein
MVGVMNVCEVLDIGNVIGWNRRLGDDGVLSSDTDMLDVVSVTGSEYIGDSLAMC